MTSDDPRSNDFDYKKYSLNHVEEWVNDALNCENTTPQEIYDAIVKCVDDSLEYHQRHMAKSVELLSLLKGQSSNKESISIATKKDWEDFWQSPEANGGWGYGYGNLELLSKHYTDDQLRST